MEEEVDATFVISTRQSGLPPPPPQSSQPSVALPFLTILAVLVSSEYSGVNGQRFTKSF